LDLGDEYGVDTTFNVTDLIPFTGSNDEEVDESDLRSDDRKKAQTSPNHKGHAQTP